MRLRSHIFFGAKFTFLHLFNIVPCMCENHYYIFLHFSYIFCTIMHFSLRNRLIIYVLIV